MNKKNLTLNDMKKSERSGRLFKDFLNILTHTNDPIAIEPPRSETASLDRLEAYALKLASELKVDQKTKLGRPLVLELKKTSSHLLQAYSSLIIGIRAKQTISPAAEWFVDNFHIIEDQILGIRKDLPVDFYRELPKVSQGLWQGYPRVYAMASDLLTHKDCVIDAESLRVYVNAYQRNSPLTIGELWALPLTLRAALLDQLRPIALRIASSRLRRNTADEIADDLLAMSLESGAEPHALIAALSARLGPVENFDRSLIVRLVQRLRDQDPNVWPAYEWLEKQLESRHGISTSRLVQMDHQRQASAQVTVGNIISSMRYLGILDWRDFFESVSVVEPILRRDPADVYGRMDFATRDRYRHEIERISRRSSHNEMEVAQKLVAKASAAPTRVDARGRAKHIGYFLLDEGVREFESDIGYKPRIREKLERAVFANATLCYIGSIAVLTAVLVAIAPKSFWPFGFPLSLIALDLAVTFVNHYVTLSIHPKALPRIETEDGIPGPDHTMVAVPTLFSSHAGVKQLIDALEIRYLANPDPKISFALLGDFTDSSSEIREDDDEILATAEREIARLNLLYARNVEPRFHLFHRRRLWNPSEERWIGWERKRGKLLEFNRVLRGATNTSFIRATASRALCESVKYVITLDSDTQLPRDAARRLIGIILHPLNQPHYDQAAERVTEGYGILQPRIGVDLSSALSTRFSKLFSGNTGLDPYTTAVSDVYQDLFAEGSFTGKGLYVVDAFEQALEGRVPENSVLSHDLFEGSYARSALVTDVEFLDDYPSDYDTFSKRAHRWTRGDWQIAPWLFPRVRDAKGRSVKNPLSLISRWKIFDNLRRSLMPTVMVAWLALAWTLIPETSFIASLPVLIVVIYPIYAPIVAGRVLRRGILPWKEYFRSVWFQTQIRLAQIFITLAFLADQTWNQTDAIVRTLYRKIISKKKLLEWVTFAQSHAQNKTSKFSYSKSVGPSAILSMAIIALVSAFRREALPLAIPFCGLWLITPFIKLWINGKAPSRRTALTKEERLEYRRYARRTWHFFETFVTEKDHWLAPDNYQTDPAPVVAHRTSPTNIGLQLLSSISAYDFGYVGITELAERLERTFTTLGRLEKMRGHFYNWYDTLTLGPLNPRYISTVDSGNLAGHLFVVKQACLEISREPHFNPSARAGLVDTFNALTTEMKLISELEVNAGSLTVEHLRVSLAACHQLVLITHPKTLARWRDLLQSLLSRLLECEDILNAVAAEEVPEKFRDLRQWLSNTLRQVSEFQDDLNLQSVEKWTTIRARYETLAAQAEKMAMEMDFKFLFNAERKVFSIGFNATDSRLDNSFYDLLASESRLTSFVAIAKGDVPQEHWFRLGRQMTEAGSSRALISWTATMFEYLMPLLVMKRYEDTLLDRTYDAAVARQIEYGRQQQVPWGISEAGYNARDLNLNFQYGPFGVPGLGLKRGLSEELVISPYSTMLASMVEPRAALENLRRLEALGVFSHYGFFESIDYTPERLEKGHDHFILRSHMAHHEGMSLLALNNLLNRSVLQNRFHAEPRMQATELLLQERIPEAVHLAKPRAEEARADSASRFSGSPKPRFYSEVNLATPRTQLLSNGNYAVMLTAAGGGYSRAGKLSVNRWREDPTRDHWGQFIYLRDRASGEFWSVAHQPVGRDADRYSVTFGEEKVEYLRRDGDFFTHTEIIVSPEDDVELRRVTLTNRSKETAEIEVTSFMEAVFAPQADDNAHPAFSNLFVQTEYHSPKKALLATRRRRSNKEAQVWGFHLVVTEGSVVGTTQFETDRARFLGRGRSAASPRVVRDGRPLSGTTGSVIDPVLSLRETIRIPAGESARVTFTTGITASREQAIDLVDKYSDPHFFGRATKLAWTQSKVQLRHLNIDTETAHRFQRLAGRIIFSNPSLRPRKHVLAANEKSQSGLWAYGISGDLPIVLTRISDEKDMAMIRELLHAHEYLRLRGLAIDLVILNERAPSYLQSLQEELQRQIRMSGSQALLDKPGGIFMRRADLIPPADQILLKSVARIVISAEKGTLDEQLKRRANETELPKLLTFSPPKKIMRTEIAHPSLQFFNGLGGFTEGYREYAILLKEDQWTPLPWSNVIANSHDFGFVVSESGSGFTWSVNSRENRLTTWSNDPISDPASEALYIRDEESGEIWSPTPLPIRENDPYLVRHGHGYTRFEHNSHGIAQVLDLFVPLDAPIKLSRLKLKNLGSETRSLSLTSYTEWVLGFSRSTTAPMVNTEVDESSEILFARNCYNNEFASRVAFTDVSERTRTYTGDRSEFLGRNGHLSKPESLLRSELSNTVGAGFDPCSAIQVKVELKPGEEREIVFTLGQAETMEKAREIALAYRDLDRVKNAFAEVEAHWEKILGTIEIETPDTGMNALANRWLIYQTLACRMWARSAFYQSGGAFGFRDQLQDSMAMVYSRPDLTRAQILIAAARQFKEGDVQHWWHPPTGRGVRTHFSDDLLWLPFVTSFYVEKTGDTSILDEVVPFIEAPLLEAGQDDAYTHPWVSTEKASLREHCARAFDRSLKVGVHGLPLMGSGDWNDGMNRVGHEGKGESVWVAWFLQKTLRDFLPHLANQTERLSRYHQHLDDLKVAVETDGWDGEWYRRAYFDDGTPLGSSGNMECKIDSIAQSWAVLSGAGDQKRAVRAMEAVDEHLINQGDGLIKLFTPPFDHTDHDPGYIKGYLPGVRENGGQYTHAAIWTVMAYAELGEKERTNELYAMLNPIYHATTRANLQRYKVEPYVIAADIYGMSPHVGRGGWTWYTGSASWMYRAALESILGFHLVGKSLQMKPCIPSSWNGFKLKYRRGNAVYSIDVIQHSGAGEGNIELDGRRLPDFSIPLAEVDDPVERKFAVTVNLYRDA
ncbi:MAG: hypothetical protein H7301_09475 [Cryobacterium sp.]|nr:hypothetical protein [Oligoflexia bacterium]